MPVYLLDTNAFSELVNDPEGKVAHKYQRVESDPGNAVLLSIVTACEARYGVQKRRAKRLAERVEELLDAFLVVPLDVGVDSHYAHLRTDLELRGQPIGPNDMLIAAHALALDAILVTDNTSEFRRVKGLRVENWLRG
ncbi:MAG TPA: type II toxin-antitoxin system VapC family toxin [Acidobacteriaceae bacterium]|nr:type II toxin-antitoxin system VapC family toxin [Acidobacteriaceae bacterium]